jgi:hypothetical protein
MRTNQALSHCDAIVVARHAPCDEAESGFGCLMNNARKMHKVVEATS